MTPLIVKNADRLSQTAVFHDMMTPVLYRMITIWPVLDRSSLYGYHTKTRFSFSQRVAARTRLLSIYQCPLSGLVQRDQGNVTEFDLTLGASKGTLLNPAWDSGRLDNRYEPLLAAYPLGGTERA